MSENNSKDKQFEDYLKGQDQISAAYRAGSDKEPPANLDRMILNASKQAVNKKPRIAYSPFSSNWTIPASIAAILVLSISIVPLMQESEDISDLNQLSDTYEPARQKMDAKSNLIEEKGYRDQPASMKAPKPSVSIQSAPSSDDSRTILNDAISPKSAEVMRAKPAMKKRSRKIMAPTSAPAPMKEAEESVKEQIRSYAAPAGKMKSKLETQPSKQRMEDKTRPESDRENSESMMGLTSGTSFILSPKEWIKNIKELHEAGKTEEAKKSLEEFRKKYPDYKVDINLDNQ